MSFISNRSSSGRLLLPDPSRVGGQLGTAAWSLLAIALVLTGIGIATIHSATAGGPTGYALRQTAFLGVAAVAFLLAFLLEPRLLLVWSPWLYGLSLFSLVLVVAFGHQAGGATGWFRLGQIGIQPSEFAKIATLLLLARYLGGLAPERIGVKKILGAVGIALVPMLLISIQPDLGGAAMFVPMVATLLLVAGVQPRWMVLSLVAGITCSILLWHYALKPYQRDRILTFLNPLHDPQGAGYQLRQAQIAVGSGQAFGRGYLQGTQSRLRFLPARHTDFILAVLAEEWGFAGVAVVFSLYALFFTECGRVARRARERAGLLILAGWTSTVAFHVLYNSAMVVGLLPVTGIPLPFLSYGGSFLVANYLALGLMLSVDSRRFANL